MHKAVLEGKAELIPILAAAGADVDAKASACASRRAARLVGGAPRTPRFAERREVQAALWL